MAAEVVLSVVLLVGAGLLVRSLVGVLSADRGFQAEDRMMALVSIPRSYGEARVNQALGAEHRAVLRLVFVQGMRPVVVGILLGLGAMLWLSQLMTSLLFNVTPRDPVTYATVVTSLILVAALGGEFPVHGLGSGLRFIEERFMADSS